MKKTTKTKPAAPPKKDATVYELPSGLMVRSDVQNAAAMMPWAVIGEPNIQEVVKALRHQTSMVTEDGCMKSAEEMLYGQAVALQNIFTHLSRRAALNANTYPQATETYLKLAFKAQSQCRSTLEALAEIKNPRSVAFVRQANIAAGHQQVNNGTGATDAGSPAREIQAEPSKLLEATHGERLDFGAQGAAGGAHQDLATVGALDRAAD